METTELCDKCGKPVPRENNTAYILYLAFEDPRAALFGPPRHFLPVVEEGELVCEGSPSRAQYIEGQPRDRRGYPYDESVEPFFREGYHLAQVGNAART